ncbi:hypothetical protein N7504_009020 [Penicillium tannophilum]|nr:hypothetical protein N7504_009020 [Penicillium tannophilum]
MHPPQVDPSTPKLCIANKVNIKVSDPHDHYAPAIIHEPPIIYEVQSYGQADKRTSAVVLVSGAGGGVSGPGGIYPSLADKIALLLSIPCIRLDYRIPAETKTCTADIRAAFDHLHEKYGAKISHPEEPTRVLGVVAIASQVAGTEGIKSLAPRPLLLLHGEDDTVLSPSCSETLFHRYGNGGDRRMRLFPG